MIIVLLVVLGIAIVAGAVWWIAQPRLSAHDPAPDERLPLFSARASDGLRPPTQHHVSRELPREVAMLRGARLDAATPPRSRSAVSQAAADVTTPATTPDAVHPPARANGTGVANAGDAGAAAAPAGDTRAPTAPHAAIPSEAAPPLPPPPTPLSPRTTTPPPLQRSAAEIQRGPGEGAAAAVAAAAGTVQFLPGRLEVLQGRGVAEQEVRFVRPSRSGMAVEITFGRGEGPPLTHVQLRAPTVSRLHARLVQQSGGGWALENLSTTNPVIVNGEEVARGAPPRPLHDGDRLEMGEVVFRYHAR